MADQNINTGPPRKTIPLSGLRGAIARNMAQGWQAPRVSMFAEVDVSVCKRRRAELQEEAGSERKITLTPIIVRALALTLAQHPRLNAYLRESAIELADDVNIALAVSVPDGLLAPVLRNADRKTVPQIAQEAAELAAAARAGNVPPRTLQGGTFTLTNLGMTDIDWFSPIINPPQVAILGVSRVIEKVVAHNGSTRVGPMMGMTLVFDHRAVDGYPAAQFLSELKQRLAGCEGI